MKIRVSYAELMSGPGYNHQRAEAGIGIEIEVNGDLDKVFAQVWDKCKSEVKKSAGNKPTIIDDCPF